MTDKKRIFYIDLFRKVNSNPLWLKAFRKYGETLSFDIRGDLNSLSSRVGTFHPDHIHVGGSVKNGLIQPELLAKIKSGIDCTISVFYGDGRYSTYHAELSPVADHIYINNKTHITQNLALGLTNFRYLPCPTDPEVFRRVETEKTYDLLFIGNNNSAKRLDLLRSLHERFDLTVAGRGWKDSPIKALGEVYGPEFSRCAGQARIVLGLIDDEWAGLASCFSNRVVNTLACGAFFIQRYTPALETIFTNHEHLVWYHSEEELYSQILRYLNLPEERRRIGHNGRTYVLSHFTYDQAVARILQDAGHGATFG